MVPNDSNWDDSGFEPNPNDNEGFAKPQSSQPELQQMPAKQQKKKSALFWFALLSSIVLLISVIGGGIYWMSQPSAEEQAFYASREEESTVTVPSTQDSALQAPLQSATDSGTTSLVEETQQERARADDKVAQHMDRVKSAPSDEKPQHAEPSQPIAQSKPHDESRLAETSKPVVPSKPAERIPDVVNKPAMTTKTSASNNPLYVIQVFSSPSRDDADEWLQSLLEKNVSNGYITEQKIKGQSWFRVRFGQFTTRESAESEAMRLGFREPWIARVR